jgi:hypothetical protein
VTAPKALFRVEQRDAVRDRVVALAETDDRVVAGAIVGSLALAGDRWADLDLTFAIREGVSANEVLDDLSSVIASEFSAVRLFDLPRDEATYRVFLLPGCLQFDLSVAPSSAFMLVGEKVKLLFGTANRAEEPQRPGPETDFGYAVHHVLRARFCIERDRYWQAEYWISAARDHALTIACLRNNIEFAHGRGFDRLPPELLSAAGAALVRSPERDELLRALGAAIDLILTQSDCVPTIAPAAETELRLLTRDWSASTS